MRTPKLYDSTQRAMMKFFWSAYLNPLDKEIVKRFKNPSSLNPLN